MTRYTWDQHVVRGLDGQFYVSRRNEVTGFYTTWYVEPDPTSASGWRIWKPTPSNRPQYITPTGQLGRAILARVRAAATAPKEAS